MMSSIFRSVSSHIQQDIFVVLVRTPEISFLKFDWANLVLMLSMPATETVTECRDAMKYGLHIVPLVSASKNEFCNLRWNQFFSTDSFPVRNIANVTQFFSITLNSEYFHSSKQQTKSKDKSVIINYSYGLGHLQQPFEVYAGSAIKHSH